MQWSPDQTNALDAVEKWYREGGSQLFRLFGYAGTGKTTLAKHIAKSTGGRVAFAAFTGKAASVLVSKGCPASTIHSLIYIPYTKSKQKLRDLESRFEQIRAETPPDEWGSHATIKSLTKQIEVEKGECSKPAFLLNEASEVPMYDLLIIDECSMVGQVMGEDLLSFGTRILVLGDPAQLPPVASGGFFTDHEPDYMLTDIHRQAENDPIIHLATQVRTGQQVEVGQYGLSCVMKRSDLSPELPLAQDQLIVGRNATRHAINRRMRELLGYDPEGLVAEGDKVVCLRNNHDLGLLNGTLWRVLFVDHDEGDQKMLIQIRNDDAENDEGMAVDAWVSGFYGHAKDIPFWEKKEAEEFDFAYALTCHKAQGSQWDNVMIFDESSAFQADARKWLYTAITRASKSVTVVL